MDINQQALRRSVLILRAVNHKLRRRMVDILLENPNSTVTDLYIQLRLEQSVASQHLAVLRRAGIVSAKRSGKFIRYKVLKDKLEEINIFTMKLASEPEKSVV